MDIKSIANNSPNVNGVSKTNKVAKVDATNKLNQIDQTNSNNSTTNNVSISKEAIAMLKQTSSQEVDMQKVLKLKEEIANGSYKPNSQNIADKLINEAISQKPRTK